MSQNSLLSLKSCDSFTIKKINYKNKEEIFRYFLKKLSSKKYVLKITDVGIFLMNFHDKKILKLIICIKYFRFSLQDNPFDFSMSLICSQFQVLFYFPLSPIDLSF